ncbi:hypothetical protein llap_11417 [Limosa lapponica baueri]|uniref:Uncharacterized protein n=1 Tax=Limosa lapponica baueri TaxID=1758121 RepID=A0A2I0TWT9_LIMLA|nr:hypothetical protein llap_11417 [Limosa lapponica baueri]
MCYVDVPSLLCIALNHVNKKRREEKRREEKRREEKRREEKMKKCSRNDNDGSLFKKKKKKKKRREKKEQESLIQLSLSHLAPTVDRVTHGNLTFLTNQPKKTSQDPKKWEEFAMKLLLGCSASGFRDSKASSRLYSPDLCFQLALSLFVVVAVLMERLGTDCAFLRGNFRHVKIQWLRCKTAWANGFMRHGNGGSNIQERDLESYTRKKFSKDKISISAVQKLTLCKEELCVSSLELGPCLLLPPGPHHLQLHGRQHR